MFSRREFLRHTSLVAFAPLVPAFLPRLAAAAGAERDAPVLVVIQMDGGNDGLNTVVPFADDAYARARPVIGLKENQVVKLDDQIGLHPAMRGAADLFNDGRLAIVHGVGYPNPNRSHFESMAIWQTARLGDEVKGANGWIGSAFDGVSRPVAGPDAVYVGVDDMPRALTGRKLLTATFSRAEDLEVRLPVDATGPKPPESADDVASFVERSMLEAYGTARDLTGRAKAAGATAPPSYPGSMLAQRLSLVSRLIKAGGGTRVYYVTQTGYDTHGAQLVAHADLLGEFSGALKAFLDDLKAAGLSERVMVLAFSEFGRRVKENSSAGTDHGTAGPIFVAGDAVTVGFHGATPSLTDLDEGDIRIAIDFRRVYATLLEDWLKVPAKQALAGEFERLELLKTL